MSDFVSWLKDVYIKAISNDFEWKPIYPNNLLCNGVEGVYTDMFFKQGDTYTYIKYSIEYARRVDSRGLIHPEEPIKYYVLHELILRDLPEPFEIPEPSNKSNFYSNAHYVSNYGRFRCVFDDEETAKGNIQNELIGLIYPAVFILNEEEEKEWKAFLEKIQKEQKVFE